MVYISRISLCGLLLCCLLFFPNVQSARGRVLENHLQFREVPTPGEQKIEALKGVVSVASWLKVNVLHTGSPLVRGGTFLKNNLWKKSKSHEPSSSVGSLILSGDHKKRGAGFGKLDKGTPTPGSGPNPGGNQLPLMSQHKERVAVHVEENFATNSLPKGSNAPSGPNRLHREETDKITRSVGDILKEEASESEKQALQSAPQSVKDEGDAEKLVFNAQLLPKGVNPPSGPSKGHNSVTLTALEGKEKLAVNSLPKSPTTPSGPNPGHNAVIASENLEKLHLELLPNGPTPPTGPNPGHNGAILAALEGTDKLAVNSLPKGPTTPSGPNPGHNAVIASENPEKLHPELLPQGVTTPSGPNPGHNGAILAALEGKDKLAVNSLPKGPTTPSGPNPGHNAVIASENPEKLHLELLPKGPTPPSEPNPGHNGAILVTLEGANELAVNSLPKRATTPLGPNPRHNAVTENEKLHMELLPQGTTPPSVPNPGHNSVIESGNPKTLHMERLPQGPVPPSSPNPIHNLILNSKLVQKELPAANQVEIVQDSSSVLKTLSSKHSLEISEAHNAAESARPNSLEDKILVLNKLPKSPGQSYKSSPNPIHYSIHTTASQKTPVSDDHGEICELSFDFRQNLSELVGCQQDSMAMAPATLFRPAAMQQGMHNFFAAGIARDTLPRS